MLVCFAITIAIFTTAQSTKNNNDPDEAFKIAKEYWQKEQYSLAFPIFKSLYTNANGLSNLPVHIQVESKYYTLVCGLWLNDVTIEPLAVEFIELEANAHKVGMMSYHLAEYYYRKRKFSDASNYYAKTTIDNLTNREIADMKFHQAYGYFTIQQFDKAKPLFNAIRQLTTDPNYTDANYYYGFIMFYEKKYKEALSSFQIVEKVQHTKTLFLFTLQKFFILVENVTKQLTMQKML